MQLTTYTEGSRRRSRQLILRDPEQSDGHFGRSSQAMSSRKGRRWTLASALGAAILVAAPVPAEAALYNEFDISGPSGDGGSGRTFGSLEFFNSPASQFRVGGNVGDICPGDSRGMELQILVQQNNGANFRRGNVIQDLNGCGNGFIQLNPPVTFTAPGAINRARAELWATEQGSPVSTAAVSVWKVR